VEWSYQAHRSVKSIAEALDIHPFMLSLWFEEYREGKFAMKRVKNLDLMAITNRLRSRGIGCHGIQT